MIHHDDPETWSIDAWSIGNWVKLIPQTFVGTHGNLASAQDHPQIPCLVGHVWATFRCAKFKHWVFEAFSSKRTKSLSHLNIRILEGIPLFGYDPTMWGPTVMFVGL